MKICLSPAKTFAKEVPAGLRRHEPLFITETKQLVTGLQAWKPEQYQKAMHVSQNIAHLNHERYQLWHEQVGHPALAYFKGDVYRGVNVDDFDAADWDYAQAHVNILSGLYGILRANDSIKNYRLEMGTKWSPNNQDLYTFWGDKISQVLNKSESEVIINLASMEYWKSVDQDALKLPVITPIFKEKKDGKYKIVAIYAKRARGLMTRYAIKNKITDPEDLKQFDLEGYKFDESLSSGTEWVFTSVTSPS